jgi:uncharacterized protein (DUF58 family)
MAIKQPIKYLDPLVVSKLKNIEIKAKLIVEGFITGMHRSPYHGFSVEFAEHRAYNAGESLRNIDWKVFGKTDKLYSKRYEEETNLRCQVVMDVSDSMRYPQPGPNVDTLTKLEYGSYLAAALQYLMISQRDAAGLTLFDEDITFSLPAKAKFTWMLPMFKELEKVIASKEFFTHKTAAAPVLHKVAMKFHRRSFVVLITDLISDVSKLDEVFKAMQHLRHAKHEVLVFHLLDKKTEENFEFPNRPVILRDLESGEKLEVRPSQIKDEYQRLMKEYKTRFKQKCYELNIDLVDVDISTPYDKVLTDYLVKRSRLK